MEGKAQFTVEEILDITIKNLGSISVPIALDEQIAVPIKQNITNLAIAAQMIKQEKAAKAEAKKAAEEGADAEAVPEAEEEAVDGQETDAE